MKKVNENNISQKAGGKLIVGEAWKCPSCTHVFSLMCSGGYSYWTPERPTEGTIDDGCDTKTGKICPDCKEDILVQIT